MDRIEGDPFYTDGAKKLVKTFLAFKKEFKPDRNVAEKYMEYINNIPVSDRPDLYLLYSYYNMGGFSTDDINFLNKLIDDNPFYLKPGNENMLIDDFEDYRLSRLEMFNPRLVKKYSQQLYQESETEKKEIENKYKAIKKYNEYIKRGGKGDLIKEIEDVRKEMIDFNSRNIDKLKFPKSYFKNLDYYKKNTTSIEPQKPPLKISQPDNYFGFNPTYNYTLTKTYNTASIEPQKPPLKISQPDNYFGFNPTYNYNLTKTYNTASIEPLHEDNNTLSKANKKLQDDYNTLSIAKNKLEEDYKNINEKNEEMKRLNITLKNELDRLDNEFNDNVKNIIGEKNKQIEELKKKNKLAIGKGTEFEVNNKKMDVKDIQTDTPTQINKDSQTALPSLYITEFRETYNQQGDYNKRVEAIQENAKRKIEAIKKIYNQSKADLQDEFNNLTNQLKEEYRNKKIRQNEYFKIHGKEQPEDNNSTNKLVLTNNKVMADITPQMKLPPIRERLTPPQETNTPPPPEEQPAKEEEDKPEEDKPIEEPPTKDIIDDANAKEEEEEDKPEEKKEEKKVIPIEKVGEELAKIIDSFYIQDKPIEETFSKLEETINNIPDDVFYQIEPYVASALANITVDGQKVFNDEAEVQQLLLKIKNPNKINKRYKLPKHLDKAITQSHQRQLTISPMLLRNRKQTNINKNIYQY